MDGLPLGRHIVNWILNRCKVINIHVVRDNNDSARVLSSRPLDSGSSLRQTLNFCVSVELPVVALIALDKSIGRLSRNGTNGSSPKGMMDAARGGSLQVWLRKGETVSSLGLYDPQSGTGFTFLDFMPEAGEQIFITREPAGGSDQPTGGATGRFRIRFARRLSVTLVR